MFSVVNFACTIKIVAVTNKPHSGLYSLSQTKNISIHRYLEAHPVHAEAWIRENASTELKLRLQTCCLEPTTRPTTSSSLQPEDAHNRGKRNSITSDLFQSWLASNSPIKRSRIPSRFTPDSPKLTYSAHYTSIVNCFLSGSYLISFLSQSKTKAPAREFTGDISLGELAEFPRSNI